MAVLLLCHVYGWTLEYATGLKIPVFIECLGRVRQVMAWDALNCTTMGIAAAFDSERAVKLAGLAGDVFSEESPKYTDADLKAANERIEAILAARRKQETEDGK